MNEEHVVQDLDHAALIEAAAEQRRSLRKQPLCVQLYLDMLKRQGLTQTEKLLSGFRSVI